MLGEDIEQNVEAGGTAVVYTGKGDIKIGITLWQYEASFKRRENIVTTRLKIAQNQEQMKSDIKLRMHNR